jgi:isoquinoline 1-oxidoreductase beta subunit
MTSVSKLKVENLSRREFLKTGVISGGGLVLGFSLPFVNKALARQEGEAKASYPVDAWLQVDEQGAVTFVIPCSEMGQGSQASLAMILADEAGVDYHTLQVLNPTNNRVFNNPMMGMQLTGGSTSVRAWWVPLREVGATLREMLAASAAKQWKVKAEECTTQDNFAIHKPSGRKLHFKELVEATLDMKPPVKPKVKERSEYRYIGKPLTRVDTPAKVTGEAVFGMDVVLPGMLIATVKQSPAFGGEVAAYNEKAALKVAGVKAVVPVDNGIAVVAKNYWQAKKGMDMLDVKFKGGKTRGRDTASIEKQLDDGLADDKHARTVISHGDLLAGKVAKNHYHMKYTAPYLAHTTMEPMNAVAHVTDEFCELWAPTQSQSLAVQKAMEITGLLADQVRLHTTYLGGGFGRRAETDFVEQAVIISEAVEAPVKLIWSREEDVQHDVYRPAAASDFNIAVDKAGYPLSWKNRVCTTSIMQRFAPQWVGDKPDASMTEGAAETPYTISNQLTDVVQVDNGVPVGFWRSVGNSLNCFFLESVLDELAHHAGKDPYQYRRHLLKASPRALNVLDAAARAANWDKPLGNKRGRGIALTNSFGSYVAQVAEVSVTTDGFKVDRIVCAVDCGLYINPAIIKQQMQSGIIYGLTAALKGKIHFEDGAVVESNFHDYPALLMSEVPEIEVLIVDNNEDPGGFGEPGTPPVAPAVANAIFAATGKRYRSLPLS